MEQPEALVIHWSAEAEAESRGRLTWMDRSCIEVIAGSQSTHVGQFPDAILTWPSLENVCTAALNLERRLQSVEIEMVGPAHALSLTRDSRGRLRLRCAQIVLAGLDESTVLAALSDAIDELFVQLTPVTPGKLECERGIRGVVETVCRVFPNVRQAPLLVARMPRD